MEPVESLYKECQWHTNEDETMLESKASIWWKTVHWSQCNVCAGMHRHFQMRSRYLTNFKEEFFSYPTSKGFLVISIVQNLLTAKILAALFLIDLFTKRYLGAYRSFDATRETREGKKKKIIKLFGAVLVT